MADPMDTPTFTAFLQRKKIAADAFAQAQPDAFAKAEAEYAVLGAVAFDQRKKFYINDWRLMFPLADVPTAPAAS